MFKKLIFLIFILQTIKILKMNISKEDKNNYGIVYTPDSLVNKILDLIPFSNNIEKLNGMCTYCINPSIYSKRISNQEGQIVVGNDNYVPTCRNCFYKEH